MTIGERRDLREMRDADDLRGFGEFAQLLSDGDGCCSTNSRVDLIEDEGRNGSTVVGCDP